MRATEASDVGTWEILTASCRAVVRVAHEGTPGVGRAADALASNCPNRARNASLPMDFGVVRTTGMEETAAGEFAELRLTRGRLTHRDELRDTGTIYSEDRGHT